MSNEEKNLLKSEEFEFISAESKKNVKTYSKNTMKYLDKLREINRKNLQSYNEMHIMETNTHTPTQKICENK